jgi:inositol transport system ATP-binding protein
MTQNTVLEVKHISKSFPGVQALDDVSFSVKEHSVHGLCGENGAGKSTLMKIINGIYQPDVTVHTPAPVRRPRGLWAA